ncbi:hypothetical protein CRU92_04005 [Arcobacter sp. FW59]|nr:hypothetical protein CRU92_04005 [Arcobacter sp. FW59]
MKKYIFIVLLSLIFCLGILYISFDSENKNTEFEKVSKNDTLSLKKEDEIENLEEIQNSPKKHIVKDFSFDSLKSLFLSDNLNINFLKAIIQNGIDINQTDKYGMTALSYLFLNTNKFDKNKLDTLVQLGASLEINTDQYLDILNVALLNQNKEIRDSLVSYLKDKGISFEVSNNPMKYLMSMNRFLGNLDYMNEIVPNIKNVNAPLTDGSNAFLHILSIGANNKNIEYFLDNNVGVDIRNEPHKVLHAVIMNGQINPKNMIRIIELGADVNARTDIVLATPLMAAAMVADTRRAKILLDYGADMSLVDAQNQDVFDYANKLENESLRNKTIDFLKNYKKD